MLLDEKIRLFGGKLYKYYSFEDSYSLKNLYDKTIHFSKPEIFNDPFDCALGFSLDKAVAAGNGQASLQAELLAGSLDDFRVNKLNDLIILICDNTIRIAI